MCSLLPYTYAHPTRLSTDQVVSAIKDMPEPLLAPPKVGLERSPRSRCCDGSQLATWFAQSEHVFQVSSTFRGGRNRHVCSDDCCMCRCADALPDTSQDIICWTPSSVRSGPQSATYPINKLVSAFCIFRASGIGHTTGGPVFYSSVCMFLPVPQ